ncbi:MAG: NDP-sugar synthase [Candidatus Omnitrophota bacterium]
MKTPSKLSDSYAVILCGGRGLRMGTLTRHVPKPLVLINGKPILWYIFRELYSIGFRKFIFPLGYLGNMIKSYVDRNFAQLNCEIVLVDTGINTPIARRLAKIARFIPDGKDFLLLNGDAFFRFDLKEMYKKHSRTKSWLTLASAEIVSNYGLIYEKNGRVINFDRDAKIDRYGLSGKKNNYGFIYSGIAFLNKRALTATNLRQCDSFEEKLYPLLIRKGKATHWAAKGFWHSVDSPKDIQQAENIVRKFKLTTLREIK